MGYTIIDGMLRKLIRLILNIFSRVGLHQLVKYRIGLIVDKGAPRFYFIDKNGKLFEVYFEGGEYIDMIPCDTGDDGNMRKQKMELGFFNYRAGRIFISLADEQWGIGNANRLIEAVQFGTYQKIEVATTFFQGAYSGWAGATW